LAAAIQKEFGIQTFVGQGMPGVFEVSLNGEIIYNSLQHQGKLPATEQVIHALRKRMAERKEMG
jgi:predicted Rdx family selenoprotein